MTDLTRKSQDQLYWGTPNELRFIGSVGRYSSGRVTRAELLQRYIEASEHRSDWKGINRDAVMEAARRALAETQ